MNADSTHEAMITDGTSQEDRFPPALHDHYIDADELRLDQLLAMSTEYARLLEFFTLADEPEPDDRSTWFELLTSDDAVLLALILAFDLHRTETAFLAMDLGSMARQRAEVATIPNYRLARTLDGWLTALEAIETMPGRTLSQTLAAQIEAGLRRDLQDLQEFLRPAHDDIDSSFRARFHRLWFAAPSEPGDRAPARPPSDDAPRVERFLKANFYSFFNAIALLKQSAQRLLPLSFTNQAHGPAVGLHVAFLKLFQKIQSRGNEFTARHLHFYYHDVLQCAPRPIVPDSAYLTFQPDTPDRRVSIPTGTEFTAGLDENGQDVIYTAANDLLVHDAKIVSLSTLHLERDPLSSPERELNYVSAAKVTQPPVGREAPSQNGGDMRAWSLFGAPQAEATQRFLDDAAIGIAVASPVLLLKEGERDIHCTFRFDSPEGTIASFLRTVAALLHTSQEDAFFRAFGDMFLIALTTENGWHQVQKYLPLSKLVDRACDDDCLKIQIRLPPATDPISPYSPAVHGGQYDTDLPMIRFLVNPGAHVYAYSLLKAIRIKDLALEVAVKGAREMLLYNNLGALDRNSPFQPFGPVPTVGSYFIIGNPEAARKQLTSLEVEIEWADLPSERGGFHEYYAAYDLPFDNSIFQATLSVLQGGRWQPCEAQKQPKLALFESEMKNQQDSGRGTVDKRRLWSCDDIVKLLRPIDDVPAESEFGYTSLAKDGFVKFTLASPRYAFGHKEYPLLLSTALAANARMKLARLFKPVPNPPYTPLISAVSLNYRAVAIITPDRLTSSNEKAFRERVYHIHPDGFERLSAAEFGRINLLPRFDEAGSLFIGLAAREPSGTLTLLFHFREDARTETVPAPCQPTWHYLSSNRWRRLQPSHVLSDTTNGFLSSGIVTLNVPRDISQGNTIMPGYLYWLCVSVDGHPGALSSVYGIYTQALKVTRQVGGDDQSSLLRELPAGTIGAPRTSIPGIGSINQIGRSFGARPSETAAQHKTRISERLKHKDRVVAPWDYERQILDRFPQIFKVKCFPHMVTDPEPTTRTRPGHILIVVVPYVKEQSAANLRPMAHAHLLSDIKEFVGRRASRFAEITVRNPAYERIQIRCRVKFRQPAGGGHYVNVLNQALTDYLSPWSSIGYRAQFGWCIRRADIESYMRGLDYIEFVTHFSMLHIAEEHEARFHLFDTVSDAPPAQEPEVRPLYPWSIAIPVERHCVETIDTAEPSVPERAGIQDLELGSTFIISGGQTHGEKK